MFFSNVSRNSELSSLFLYLPRLNIAVLKLGFLLIVLALFGCDRPSKVQVFSGPTMGTQYRVTVVGRSNSGDDYAQTEAAIAQAIEAVNQSMSTYLPDSELSQFNRLSKGGTAVLSDSLYEVISEAQSISEFSDGAFDATLGKAVRLWGFSEDGRISQQPSPETLDALKESVGYKNLKLQGKQLTKLAQGLEVNLSAIAKGYAVDQVADTLSALGYTHFLVNIGGELRASGTNADNELWRVGVEKPHLLGGIEQVISLENEAIATSGDYRNFILLDGQQFSHTIDPLTLKPVYHKLASVSVLSNKASTADALATALLAMGDEKGLVFAEMHDIAAYFIIRGDTEGSFEIRSTGKFKLKLS